MALSWDICTSGSTAANLDFWLPLTSNIFLSAIEIDILENTATFYLIYKLRYMYFQFRGCTLDLLSLLTSFNIDSIDDTSSELSDLAIVRVAIGILKI